ncbi:uncharacterized protein LOC130718258 [Lotus japonicus]|uniref:uncharacterized protein LOC130718258 n=1 Tax=Lotus japonicus TaxID=34305 RepID=UPI0025830E17|nr:uncharacterized protein LOC130718258 [Lotus japonicus]
MAVTTPYFNPTEKKHWWLTNRKLVEKYIREARSLIATQEHSEITSAVSLLDAALAISPRLDQALELRARSLLFLRRFKDVADMLQDYIPSLKMAMAASDDSGSVSSEVSSSQQLSREGVKLLSSSTSDSSVQEQSFKCFSVSDLKKRVMAGLCKSFDKEGYWRYLVLGKACCHLGLMEDAMVLLQTGKRLASAAFRRESVCWSDDSFSLWTTTPFSGDSTTAATTPPRAPLTESESVTQLLAHIKFLLRRRAAAMAALDAGLHSEAIRHFSKILDGRRGAPQGFLAECYLHRATAFRSAGRIADSIADCNRTLALDPACIQALEARASLLESIRCYPDCLHDLEHLKLLYNSILRDRKLAGPIWKRHNIRYGEIPGKLCTLAVKSQQLKQRVAAGETRNVDYHALIGLRRGCGKSELQRAHLLLCLKHKPDKSTGFIERCELADERDLESVRDRARMSALLLYRLIQKGYSSVNGVIVEEENAEKQRKMNVVQKTANAVVQVQHKIQMKTDEVKIDDYNGNKPDKLVYESRKCAASSPSIVNPSAFQGVFCRDIAVVGNLLSQGRFNRSIPVKYEALTC